MILPHNHRARRQRPRFEVADIFNRYFDDYRANHEVSRHQSKVVGAIRKCRTAALGAHVLECDRCGYVDISYNSCRNRHCPKCQSLKQEKWVQARLTELLPIYYHHSVFTLPDGDLRTLMLYNKVVMYDIFFHSAAGTLHTFARDPKHLGAESGFIGILHTWGQTLCYHPHLHFIVTGGGISFDGRRWVALKYGDKFLFPVKAMSKVMRGKFIAGLKQAYANGLLKFEGDIAHLADPVAFDRFLDRLAGKAFVIYNRPPFACTEHVVEYIGRYTHRVALSNYRLIGIENGQVRFRYKDNNDGGKQKVMTLSAEEFIRRFLLHILPAGFKKVRHFGFLSGGVKKVKLALARRLLAAQGKLCQVALEVGERLEALVRRCPKCKAGRMTFKTFVDPSRLDVLRRLGFGSKLVLDGL